MVAPSSGVQRLGVVLHMLADKGGDEVVGVIVAVPHPKLEGLAGGATGRRRDVGHAAGASGLRPVTR